MLSSTVKRYMRDPVKTYFGLLKIQVKFLINIKLESSMRPVCLLMIFLIFIILYLIIEPSREKALLTLHELTEMQFLLQKNLKNIMHGHVKMYVMR